VQLTLVRNATLQLDVAAGTVLVDPMLNPRDAVPAVEDTAPAVRNPLVDLPCSAESLAGAADAVLVTHLHNDHFDDAARRLLSRAVSIFCQPTDAERLRADGFAQVSAVDDLAEVLPGLTARRVPARHTLDVHVEALGQGSGYVLTGAGPITYVAGDCVFSPELVQALDDHRPDVVVLNGGAARFLTGPPISMTAEDIILAARHAPDAHMVVVHLEALNHCPMTREELRRHLRAAGLSDRVSVPEDGQRLLL